MHSPFPPSVNRVIITGGFGFIGSNLVRYWLRNTPDQIMIMDNQTYAARPDWVMESMTEANKEAGYDRVQIAHVDISDYASVLGVIDHFRPNIVIHLAAETHVCNSIKGPRVFLDANVIGTFNIIEAIRQYENSYMKEALEYEDALGFPVGFERVRFHHVSTDEVYGELGPDDPSWTLESPYLPRSPYAATKAASDLLVQSYVHTYGLRATISNCTNNFGPNQHPEKLIPRTIARFLRGAPATVYGSGDQVRDWLFVEDHCRAIHACITHGRGGQKFLVSGENEFKNLTVISAIGDIMRALGAIRDYELVFTNDRPTDDFRYSLDNKSTRELGWAPSPRESFINNLRATVAWYMEDPTRLEE